MLLFLQQKVHLSTKQPSTIFRWKMTTLKNVALMTISVKVATDPHLIKDGQLSSDVLRSASNLKWYLIRLERFNDYVDQKFSV